MRGIAAAVLSVVLFAPAYFIWSSMGPLIHLAAAVAGIGIGWLVAWPLVRRYESGLRVKWNTWMRLAEACESVDELHRKSVGRRQRFRTVSIAIGLTVLWVAEIGLIALAFVDVRDAISAIPILAANGLLAGLMIGWNLHMLSWTRTFHRSLGEMLRDGEIGVWGTMG